MIDLASYFGDVTKIGKVAFYTLMASILVVYSLIGLAAPLLRPVCTPEPGATPGDNRGPDSGVEGLEGSREGAPNPSYRPDPCRWRRYDEGRQAAMKAALQQVMAAQGLSRDCFEIASKSLGEAG